MAKRNVDQLIRKRLAEKKKTKRKVQPGRAFSQKDAASQNLKIDMARATAREQGIGRNDPCPCKSGKKYKKCCQSARKFVRAPSRPMPKKKPSGVSGVTRKPVTGE